MEFRIISVRRRKQQVNKQIYTLGGDQKVKEFLTVLSCNDDIKYRVSQKLSLYHEVNRLNFGKLQYMHSINWIHIYSCYESFGPVDRQHRRLNFK